MHVLIVAYHYPPDNAVGALRPARMAEAFAIAGHRVTVITAKRTGKAPADAKGAPAGITVSTVAYVPNPRELYLKAKRLLQRIRRSRVAPTEISMTDSALAEDAAETAPLWKRSVISLLWLPDDRQGFAAAAAAAARRIHRRQAVDWVVTTAPPFSAHLAGLLIQRSTRARWAADFRDPWTDNPWKAPIMRTAASDRIEAWLEQRVVSRADLVVSASEGIHSFFAGRSGVPDSKSILVRNGIERVMERRPPSAGSPFRILHMGTFYHQRDPRPFLEAVAEVRGRHPDCPILVDFVGSSRTFRGHSIPHMVQQLALEETVVFHDFMPREKVAAMAATSDLLLLLAQGQPNQVPQKLYEYLGTRVPILAFADRNGESARMLDAVGDHAVVLDNDPSAAALAIETALLRPREMPAGDPAVLSEWTTERQLRRLLDAMNA